MIKTFTGPMHSGKTKAMIDVYNGIYNKEHVACFKPSKDSRELGLITSKDYDQQIPAILVDRFEDILMHVDDKISTIFIDEVQMIEGNVSVLSYLSIVKDMDIYVAGLNMTSEQDPFLVMPYILAISDEVEIIKASCFDCGRGATYTYYDGVKTDAILVGDANYIPLCPRCIMKRRGEKEMQYLLKKKDTKQS